MVLNVAVVSQVLTVAQIKFVEDEDLVELGMTKPEMRRLKRFFRKESEPGALAKFKKVSALLNDVILIFKYLSISFI